MTQNRNLLVHGLGLTLRRSPALLWAFLFNLGFSALTTARIAGVIGHVTNTSLAAQPLHHGFDLGTLASLGLKLNEGPGVSPAFTSSIVLYLATYFLLVPGTLLCYQTGAPARLSTLLQVGLLHFWRFVRITLLSLIVFGIILGSLAALQSRWATHVDRNTVGRHAFFAQSAGILLIALVAAILRLYFDLVEVYTVQLGLQLRSNGKPDRRVRKTLLPAFRALRYNFGRLYPAFLLLAILGFAAVAITARVAVHSLGQPRIWPMFFLVQTGLFVMLLTRFWQRGAETALSLELPMIEEPILRTTFVPRAVPLETSRASPPFAATPSSPLTPASSYSADPIPNPEPSTPSLPNADPGIYRRRTAHVEPAIAPPAPVVKPELPPLPPGEANFES